MENPAKENEPVKVEAENKEPIKEPEKVPAKEPAKEEEPVKEPRGEPVDNSKEIEGLKATILELEAKAEKVEEVTLENTTLKTEIETVNTQLKAYEELVGELVNTKLAQVPEEFKELIPSNLDLRQKLDWLTKAEDKGLFNKEEKKAPAVEIGKPMNMESDSVDTAKLTGSQLLKLAYNTIKK